jgi:nitrite reductase (cytochrome c-552)
MTKWRTPVFIAAGGALATFLVLLLLTNIIERKEEGKRHVFKVVDIREDTIDPAEWGKNYPRQFDSYKRTVDTQRTRHGGSDAFQKLDEDPVWRVLFKGYAFGIDYREERGHAYMLSDQDMTERVKHFPQPGACLHCHSSVIPAYKEAGGGDIQKGFEKICAMPYADARKLVSHPVSCVDCHEPESLKLRVSRPAFFAGIRALAKSEAPVPHLPSIERWRKDGRKGEYDVNREASRQEMRSFVCGQCHVEYYFKGEGKLLTYPWHEGLKLDQAESYYEKIGHVDWKHGITGAPMLKAQHPEFEFWSQGIHARSGVACADCHMPYLREGAVKVSDHHVRSPLLNVAKSCQTCHRYPEQEILDRAAAIQDRTRDLRRRAQEAVFDLVKAIEAAPEARREKARPFHRKSQWRLDYVFAENSSGFHAPGEAARLLAESIDYARQGVKALSE